MKPFFHFVFLFQATVIPSLAGDGNPNAQYEAPFEELRGLSEEAGGLEWDNIYRGFDQAFQNMWRQNGWNEEADQFARDVAREVGAIPPWDMAKRIDVLTDRISGRYGFSSELSTKLRGAVVRETASMVMRHAPFILGHAREFLKSQAENRPFTAEEVAKWVREGEPLMNDGRAAVERIIAEVEPSFDESQRKTLGQDLKSFRKRQAFVDDAAQRWAKGQWHPKEWGFPDNTADSTPADFPSVPNAGTTPLPESNPSAKAIPSRWVPEEPQTWVAYVVEVTVHLRLDPGQSSTAESIRKELVERAEDFLLQNRTQVEGVSVSERSRHVVFDPIRALFDELKLRVIALSTTEQRNQAETQVKVAPKVKPNLAPASPMPNP